MANSTDQQVLQQLQAERAERELAEKMRLVQAYGRDDYEDGTALQFVKHYDADPVRDLPAGTYDYVALKAAGRWYITGQTGRGVYDWDSLRVFWVSGTPVREINLMVVDAPAITIE